jgi:hypothetical protein
MFVLGSRIARAADPVLKPVLIEGTWTHRGARSILGSGTDTTIHIRNEGNRWTLTYEVTRYPSVNDKGSVPKTERQGPYPVVVEDQELVITKDQAKLPARYTFLCDERRLILPAFVQKTPGEWSFRAEKASFTARCEADPFTVPVGRAQIPGVLLGKGYYAFEEAAASPLWPRAQYLRFLERSDEKGELHERFRLIFDEQGAPRYERLLETGERSTSDYQIGVFIAPDTPR